MAGDLKYTPVAEPQPIGLKTAVDQRLRLRGSRDFGSVETYREFLTALVAERNATRSAKVVEERAKLHPLPVRPLPLYRVFLYVFHANAE